MEGFAVNCVWKFPLPISDRVTVEMPAGAQVLAVQEWNNAPCVWALVDPEAPSQNRFFKIVGTGYALPPLAGEYLGTVQTHGGQLVWHVFGSRQ
jgi:hypothetical protein